MQLVAFKPAPGTTESEMRQFEYVVASLSSKFAALHQNDLTSSLAQALEQVCVALCVERATLIEFADTTGVRAWHSRDRQNIEPISVGVDATTWPWLVDQVRGGSSVVITCYEDLPPAAVSEREYARMTNLSSTL